MDKTRENLMRFLGKLPERNLPLSVECFATEDKGDFILERLVLTCKGYERIPAIFTAPKRAAPFPVILFSHSNGYLYHIGKSELLDGCDYMYKPGYAWDLARMGVASLAIDHLCFEERRGPTESVAFKTMIWQGKIMLGYMIYDTIRALDYLRSRKDVDPNRIGALGMSMGSTITQWVAALDERIKMCVDICCLTNYQELLHHGNADDHGYYFFVPGLYGHFGVTDINALIAPRPHLALAGTYDPITPAEGLDRDDEVLKKAYAEAGAKENWVLKTYPVGHYETAEMRKQALLFIDRHL